MKKLILALGILGIVSSVSSCKKCGYCSFGANGNTPAVCEESGPPGFTGNGYDIEKANCDAQGGTWVVSK